MYAGVMPRSVMMRCLSIALARLRQVCERVGVCGVGVCSSVGWVVGWFVVWVGPYADFSNASMMRRASAYRMVMSAISVANSRADRWAGFRYPRIAAARMN